MKAVIKYGWDEYVVSAEDALKIIKIVEGAERYARRYNEGESAYYVWDEPLSGLTLDLLTEEQYKVVKLAGKPE